MFDATTGLDEGVGGVVDPLIVLLEQQAGGLEGVGAHVGEAVEPLTLELAAQGRDLGGQHRGVHDLGPVGAHQLRSGTVVGAVGGATGAIEDRRHHLGRLIRLLLALAPLRGLLFFQARQLIIRTAERAGLSIAGSSTRFQAYAKSRAVTGAPSLHSTSSRR